MTCRTKLMSPFDFLQTDAGQIDRRPLTAVDRLRRAVMNLQAANPGRRSSWLDFDLIADTKIAAGNAPRYDRAMAGNRKRSINGHAKRRLDTQLKIGVSHFLGGRQAGPISAHRFRSPFSSSSG